MSWAGRSWELRARRALSELARDPARRASAARLLGPRLPDATRADAITGGNGLTNALDRALRTGQLDLRLRDATGAPLPMEAREARTDESVGDAVATHWIEIELLDMAGKPIASERYEIVTSDRVHATGRLGPDGRARVDGIKNAGQCQVSFPDLDRDAWESL